MPTKKRRVRTGCLTCKARRVKCDEQLPACGRCIAANVECAGYEQRRVVVTLQSSDRQQSSTSSSARSSHLRSHLRTTSSIEERNTDSLAPTPRAELSTTYQLDVKLPLVGLPSNPRTDQIPVAGARQVLGYHQALLRTLPVLFGADDLPFWRDDVFQEAWSCEFLYHTIVALGAMHRAALMSVANTAHIRASGFDMKLTAVKFYTAALESLANDLEVVKTTPILLVAALCLMAYFESLTGSIPGFIGRIQTADHYFVTLLIGDDLDDRSAFETRAIPRLRSCLRSLCQICYIALPMSRVHGTIERNLRALYPGQNHRDDTPAAALSALHTLIDLLAEHQEVKEAAWSPVVVYTRHMSTQALHNFEEELRAWRSRFQSMIPELDTDATLHDLLIYSWQATMPPPLYASTSRWTSLTAAHYNFYMARIRWTLLLLGETSEQDQLITEFYFYEALRHAASHISRFMAAESLEDAYIPCEALKVGLLPVLHITGLCSPPSWLGWIKQACEQIVQEGVLKGHTFATNLECLHRFEMLRHGDLSSMIERHVQNPADRVICQLISEQDGSHFTSFYAAPASDASTGAPLISYRVIGHARWRCEHGENPCSPETTIYDDESGSDEAIFSEDWLYQTKPASEWLSSCLVKDFQFDRALQDHINGTRLLLAGGEAT